MAGSSADMDCRLGGLLLLAGPGLVDANFRRTAVLLARHSEKGALGFVMDRPLDFEVADLLDCEDDLVARLPVYWGGPCEQESLNFVLVEEGVGERMRLHVCQQWDEVYRHLEAERLVRAVVGFSEWEAGQLEGEMTGETWLVTPAQQVLLECSEGEAEVWMAHLRELGPEMRLLTHLPSDPFAN